MVDHRIQTFFQEGTLRMKKGAGGIADRIPVSAQMSVHSAKLAGVSTLDFFTDAALFLRCELAADVYYGLDVVTIHYDVYNIESEALGAQLIWREQQIPTIDSNKPLLSSAKAFADLKPLKPGTAERMPYVLEINKRLMNMGLAPKIRFTGPFTMAANLLGLEELIMEILTDPESVHRLMKFLNAEVLAPWIVCQREHCGCQDTATGSEALASPPLLSLELIREFCLRYIEELEGLVGGIRLAGLWGESCLPEPKELLEIKRAGSPGSIQVLDPDVTALGPATFRKYADETNIALVMGLDAHLVGAGAVEDIITRTRKFIEEAGLGGRFVLTMNDIPYNTPPENVHAVIATAHEYQANSSGTAYIRITDGGKNAPEPSMDSIYASVVEMMNAN